MRQPHLPENTAAWPTEADAPNAASTAAGPAAAGPAAAGPAGAAARDGHGIVRTSCGRVLTIGRLTLGPRAHPTGRVTLNVGCQPHDHDQVWMSLTPGESRRLAAHLLAQAAAADRECAAEDEALAAGSAAPDANALPAGRIEVAFVAGETYAIQVRGHHLLTDQPVKDGGRDIAATPTELLIASLASCVAFYAGYYLSRHGLSSDGLRVSAAFDMARSPARVGAVRLLVQVPADLPAERAQALRAVASRCIVHNTMRQPPVIDIDLA